VSAPPPSLLARALGAALLCSALCALPAAARSKNADAREKKEQDPARWFATRSGLIRVYQERPKPGARPAAADASGDVAPPAGASCEVVESNPREGEQPARTRESCTMISGRKAKAPAALTYELRQKGIFLIRAETPGQKPAELERLLLPTVKKGKSWSEARGKLTLLRTVKSAGSSCKAASRSFGDCLVLTVVEKEGRKVRRSYAEVYAAGVGLVEDAQWELIDVKGL
jgi:hypothetical protein